MAMSGTPRPHGMPATSHGVLTGGATPACYLFGASKKLGPPPPATHAISLEYEPFELVSRVVPPTEMTQGEDAGYSTSGAPAVTPFAPTATGQKPPVSPDDAKRVCPCAA